MWTFYPSAEFINEIIEGNDNRAKRLARGKAARIPIPTRGKSRASPSNRGKAARLEGKAVAALRLGRGKQSRLEGKASRLERFEGKAVAP